MPSYIYSSESKSLRAKLNPEAFYCAFGGGIGRFGANFSIFSYQKITIWIDVGAGFENQDFPGIQKILPNQFLAEVFPPDIVILTHGHEDHIGAFTFFANLIPRKTCVITSPFTHALLKNRLNESALNSRDFRFKIINQNETYKFHQFDISFFFMPHSIPQTFSVGLHIPLISKKVYFTSDFKTKGIEPRFNTHDLKKYAPVDFLFCDSTGSLSQGETPEESLVAESFEKIIESHRKGRIFVTAFSSHIERIRSIFEIGRKNQRHLSVVGLSLKNYLQAALSSNEFSIPIEQIDLPQNQDDSLLCILSGCQANEYSAFYKFAHNQLNHLKAREGDLLIYSGRIIHGNEESVFQALNRLSEKGVKIIGFNHGASTTHVSGHGRQGDILNIISWLKPTKVIPIHGDALHFNSFREFVEPLRIEIMTIDTIYSLNNENLTKCFSLDIKTYFVENGEIHDDLSVFHTRKHLSKDGICNVIFDKHLLKVLAVDYVGTGSSDFVDSKKKSIFLEVSEKVNGIALYRKENQDKENNEIKKVKKTIYRINQKYLKKRPYINLLYV